MLFLLLGLFSSQHIIVLTVQVVLRFPAEGCSSKISARRAIYILRRNLRVTAIAGNQKQRLLLHVVSVVSVVFHTDRTELTDFFSS